MEPALLKFAGVALLLVLIPGPDFAVVVPNALRGRAMGTATAFGTASGLAIHAGIAAAGLSAVVLTSDLAFSAVKYLGAAFLLYLGVRALLKSRRSRPHPPALTPERSRPRTGRAAYRQGLLVNLLNPKAPLIYLSVMPQFLQPTSSDTAQLAAMSAILVGLALAWYVALTLLVRVLRPIIEQSRVWIDRVTGVVLIGLSVRVALESRPV